MPVYYFYLQTYKTVYIDIIKHVKILQFSNLHNVKYQIVVNMLNTLHECLQIIFLKSQVLFQRTEKLKIKSQSIQLTRHSGSDSILISMYKFSF